MFNAECEKPVQTRDDSGALRYFDTLEEAFKIADSDPSIYKISFTFGNERVRLVRHEGNFVYDPIWIS